MTRIFTGLTTIAVFVAIAFPAIYAFSSFV